ncbi:MAG: ATP-binding protein, partial [Verrucomicrobiota bacterium]|nr:ATP-binding protein [Verrucomicrobiota bacterium]
ARFDALPYPALLVDVGTNGEIALLHEGRIYAASTAAGPAFEGARIGQGMRASAGAIDAVTVQDGVLQTHVIGETDAAGLCGSALVDAVAELLRAGLIDAAGTLGVPAGGPPVPPSLAARVRGGQFLLDPGGACGCSAVWLTQQDIRELQLASGAIRAGIETVLRRAGLAAGDLGALLLAGGFGNTIRVRNAVRIGLLPDLPEGVIRFVGNASLTGAKRALLARGELEKAQRLRDRTAHIDLSAEPGFSDCFMDHMLFPHTEETR